MHQMAVAQMEASKMPTIAIQSRNRNFIGLDGDYASISFYDGLQKYLSQECFSNLGLPELTLYHVRMNTFRIAALLIVFEQVLKSASRLLLEPLQIPFIRF